MQEKEAPKGQYENWYYYELRLTNKGVANAAYASSEELKEELAKDLESVYGNDFEIVEIRDATQDEITKALDQQAEMAKMFSDFDDFDDVDDAEITEPTLN